MKTFQKWLLLLVCLGLLAGCGRTRPPHGPPVISAIPPPTTETVPDRLEGQPPPDIRRVHARLFQEAQVHFDGREYPKTISGLKRLLALRPEGTLEEESRWLLAQSYDRVGEWEAARDQYRRLAVAGNGHRFQADAQLKFKEIQ